MLVALGVSLASSHGEEKWIQLFDGESLDGWTPKFTGYEAGVNLNKTFRVMGGKLVVDYSGWEVFQGEFGHLFYKTPFSNYTLRVEYRFVGKQVETAGGDYGWARRNNGLMIHGDKPEAMGKDQEFPNSIEVQLLGGLEEGEERATLNACTPGTHIVVDGELIKQHVVPSMGPTIYGDDWVTVEIRVEGAKRVQHLINGEVVHSYSDLQRNDGSPLSEGTISIQAETAPIEFRKIELLPANEGE